MDGDGRQSGLASTLRLAMAEPGNPLSWDKSGFIGALCNPAANGTDGTTARDATGPGGKARGGLRDGAERPAARAPHRTRDEGRRASPVPPGDTVGQGDAAPRPSPAWGGGHTHQKPPQTWALATGIRKQYGGFELTARPLIHSGSFLLLLWFFVTILLFFLINFSFSFFKYIQLC